MFEATACRSCTAEALRSASSSMWMMLQVGRRVGAYARLGSFRGLGKTSRVWLVG